MISDEVEGFRRDFRVDASASFLKLNDAILKNLGYDSGEMTRFILTDKNWKPKQEVLLMDMGLTDSEEDLYLMEKTSLDELLEDEGDRMLFNFDMLGDRYFFLELREILLGETLKEVEVVRSKGEPPRQLTDVEELLNAEVTKQALGAKDILIPGVDYPTGVFEENQSFDPDEIDVEGFELSGDDLIEE